VKPGAVLVNVARKPGGPRRSTSRSRRAVSAGPRSWPQPPDSGPASRMDNIVATPHLGASTPGQERGVQTVRTHGMRSPERLRPAVNLPFRKCRTRGQPPGGWTSRSRLRVPAPASQTTFSPPSPVRLEPAGGFLRPVARGRPGALTGRVARDRQPRQRRGRRPRSRRVDLEIPRRGGLRRCCVRSSVGLRRPRRRENLGRAIAAVSIDRRSSSSIAQRGPLRPQSGRARHHRRQNDLGAGVYYGLTLARRRRAEPPVLSGHVPPAKALPSSRPPAISRSACQW
jgi:hypothetical protein